MKRRSDTLTLFIAGILMATGVVAILLTLPPSSSPKAQLLIELAKIFATGLVVGVIGVWAKQVLEHAEKQKQQAAQRTFARKELFEMLQRGAREALRELRQPIGALARFDYLFDGKEADFESLLEKWAAFEPDTAKKVHAEYSDLESSFIDGGERLSESFRDRAKKVISGWSRQFASRAVGVQP